MIYLGTIADAVRDGSESMQVLVECTRRDNPGVRSLRQHAGFWAGVARDAARLRSVRRSAAVTAMACLTAARQLQEM